MHVGSAAKKSKTEALFVPGPGGSSDDGDTSPVHADDTGGIVTFTQRFRYLGSLVTDDLRDDHDVDARLASASAAFAALRGCVFDTKDIKLATKKRVYLTLVVNILLYGSECWCLTEGQLGRLRVFHSRCIRSMCRVTRWQTWQYRIKSATLRDRMRLETIDHYVSLRRLRWAGHVARMNMERLPRKFLTSWVRRPRPQGRPLFTYGQSLNKTLKYAGISTDFKVWSEQAQDRNDWRERIYKTAKFPPKITRS